MTTGKFWILVALSLMIAGLVGLDVLSQIQVSALSEAVDYQQTEAARMEQSRMVLRQMLQRLADASVTDPAVANLLRDHGVHVHRADLDAAPAPAAIGTKPANAAPEVPPVAQ